MDITSIITEAALDDRIPDGVVDLKNSTHIQVIAETMYDFGFDVETINEFVKRFVEEGKYPDRQAFNKEGWLVTFPSKEYRDAAIKKGTHSISDPTHGKGGMNLYYKKKGKQKRQTSQDVSTTDEPTSDASANTSVPRPGQPQQSTAQKPPGKQSPSQTNVPGADELGPEEIEPDDTESTDSTPDSTPQSDSALPPVGKSTSPAPPAAQASMTADQSQEPAPQPPPPPPPPPYVELSKKFAAQKAWIPTPYGEWRDSQGNTTAIESLTKEVVPVKTTDREELKLFVEKHTAKM